MPICATEAAWGPSVVEVEPVQDKGEKLLLKLQDKPKRVSCLALTIRQYNKTLFDVRNCFKLF